MFFGLIVAFSWCSIWSLYELTRPQGVSKRISNALHLAMSLVMLLMVAQPTWAWLTALVPTAVWAAIFGLATLWFGWLFIAPASEGGRAHFLSHATMFASMTWHLAAMATKAASSGNNQGKGNHHPGGTGVGHTMDTQATADPTMWWFALIGLPLMAYLLISAFLALWRTFRPSAATVAAHTAPSATAHTCSPAPARGWEARLGSLAHFAMTGAMFWMSLGLLAPIIPAARLLMV